jgi:hypothetical protein
VPTTVLRALRSWSNNKLQKGSNRFLSRNEKRNFSRKEQFLKTEYGSYRNFALTVAPQGAEPYAFDAPATDERLYVSAKAL